MRIFYALLKLNFKALLQYKKTFVVSLLIDPILLSITIMSFIAIYEYNKTIKIVGYSLSQMIWYFASVTLIWHCIWNSTDENLGKKILSGDLTVDLLKPIPIISLELSNALGARIIAFLIEFIPCSIIFCLFFSPDFISFFSILKFLTAVILAFFLNFILNFLIGLTAFVIKSNQSLRSIKTILISLASGVFIPLEFFPGWFKDIISILPFQYLFYWPIQLLLNNDKVVGLMSFIRIIGFQIFWIIFFFIIYKILWKFAIRKYCAAGG